VYLPDPKHVPPVATTHPGNRACSKIPASTTVLYYIVNPSLGRAHCNPLTRKGSITTIVHS